MAETKDCIIVGPVVDLVPVTETLGRFFVRKLEEHQESVLFISEVGGIKMQMTHGQVLLAAKVCSALLREHNLQTTDTVMISCGVCFDFLPVFVGAACNGVAVAPVSPSSDRAEFQHLFNVIQPRLVLADDASIAVIEEAVKLTANKPKVLSLKEITRRLADEKAAKKAVDEFRTVDIENPEEHVQLIMTSSGTTGRPKGVEYTGHTLMVMLLNNQIMPPTTVVMSLSGPFWASGIVMQSTTLAMGGKMVLLPAFTEKDFVGQVQRYKVNMVMLGPDQITALAKWPETESHDMPSLMVIFVGGARVHPTMHELAEKRLKKMIVPGYGMTESFGVLDVAIGVEGKRGTVGTVMKNAAVKIIDVETGLPLGPNLEGEVCYKSPVTMKAYRGNPEATRDLFDEDGFIHTGDVGYYDEDGYFYIVDRIKELIKYKLMHVPAVEIEEVLLQHVGVQEAAVVGIQNLVDTEHATAFVVKQPGSDVTAQDLVKLVQDKLPQRKWLHGGAYFVDSLAKTPSGKVKKRQLRVMHETNLSLQKL